MTVTVKNKEGLAKLLVSQTSEKEEVALMVEELANLSTQISDFDPIVKKFKALKEQLIALVPEDTIVTEPYEFLGNTHKVVLSPCAKVRTISDIDAVRHVLGHDLFMKIAKVGLAELDAYLSDAEKAQIITESQTGSRKFSIKEFKEIK